MRKILLSVIILIYALPVLSQSEFRISVDRIEWKNPNDKKVILEINFKITNISSVPGACEDLKGVWLYSSDAFYNSDIEFYDANRGILQVIKPGDNIICFISFKVPKTAGGLYMKFDEEHGGAEKFISESYNKSILDEAEHLFSNKQYLDAISEFKICIDNDPSQKNSLNLKIADCYEKIGDGYMVDYNNYKVSDNLESAILNYKLCLGKDFKRSSINDNIAKAYDELGDFQSSASNLPAALISYTSSLKYQKSATVNEKIAKIDKKNLEKEKLSQNQKEIQAKKKEYEDLVKPTTAFTFVAGIGYHINKNPSTNASFWNLQMEVPVKLYTQKKTMTPLNVFLNFDAGYSGFIGTENQLNKFLNIDDPSLVLNRVNSGPILGEYYLNGGIGLSLLSKTLKPMIAIYYGVYGQSSNFNLTSVSNPDIYYFERKLSELHIGQGFKIELSLKIGSSFIFGYSYNNYKIESNIYFLNNNYSAHYLNLGLSSF